MDTSCLGKHRYPRAKFAKNAARKVERKDGSRMAAYACLWCSYWHIGHAIGKNASRGSKQARINWKARHTVNLSGIEHLPPGIAHKVKMEVLRG